jgi:hypothetical protein
MCGVCSIHQLPSFGLVRTQLVHLVYTCHYLLLYPLPLVPTLRGDEVDKRSKRMAGQLCPMCGEPQLL